MNRDREDPRQVFSRSAERYLTSTDHMSGPDLEFIRLIASQIRPRVTLDVAAGTGHALKAASPFSGVGIAMDLTMEMLLTASGHLAGTALKELYFIQSAADSMPLVHGTVSLLTCRIASHHFPSIPGFLEEVGRVLEPGGRAVIIDSIAPEDVNCARFINEAETLRDRSHVRSHTLTSWLAYFQTADLEIVSVELFERTHPFREWAARTGLEEDGVATVEKMFLDAPDNIREIFRVIMDINGHVESYTDEKGIFLVSKGKG